MIEINLNKTATKLIFMKRIMIPSGALGLLRPDILASMLALGYIYTDEIMLHFNVGDLQQLRHRVLEYLVDNSSDIFLELNFACILIFSLFLIWIIRRRRLANRFVANQNI